MLRSIAITVSSPYRHRHDYHSFRAGFPALFSLPWPGFAGAGTRRPAAPSGRPAAPAPGPSEAFPRRPSSLGVALPDLAAGLAHHGAGQAGNRDPMASQRLSALLAMALKIWPFGTAQDA